MENKKKKKVDMKAIAIEDGLDTLGTIVGFSAAHLSQTIPLPQQWMNNALPVVAGAGAIIGSHYMKKGSSFVNSAGKGLVAYGALALIRTLLSDPAMPGGEDGSDGIMGVGENETVRKILDMFVPNLNGLGNVMEVDYNAYNPNYDDYMVEDIDSVVLDGFPYGAELDNAFLGSTEAGMLDNAFAA